MQPGSIWGNVKTFFSSKIWGGFVTVFASVAKTISGPAQSYTIIKNTLTYSSNDSTPLLIGLSSPAIFVNLKFNLLSKIPAIKQVFSEDDGEHHLPPPDMSTLGRAGKITYVLLQGAELLSGGLQSALSYYSVRIFVKDIVNGICYVAKVDATTQKVLTLAEVLAQTIAIPSAIGTFGSYFSFDHKSIQHNAFKLAQCVDQRNFSFDKAAMGKTVASSGLNLISYPAISFAWTMNFIENSPARVMPTWASSTIAGILCLDTGITVALWMPTIYKAFNRSNEPEQETTKIHFDLKKCPAASIRAAILVSGVGDSAVNSGLNVFNSMTFTAAKAFKLNPYHPATITASGICAIHATIGNIFFSVLPGHTAILNLIYKPKAQTTSVETGERQPLLAKNPSTLFSGSAATLPQTQIEEILETPLTLAKNAPG
jgi:hypothetical protein